MKSQPQLDRSVRRPTTPLDAADRRILDVLQDDNQITNLALADKIGLSPPACLKRVRRLRADKVIVKDVAVLDPESVGHSIVAFVGVELDRQREDVLAAFERRIATEPEVQQCYFVSGDIDYCSPCFAATWKPITASRAECSPPSTTSSAFERASACRGSNTRPAFRSIEADAARGRRAACAACALS
jgi:Lrp/AsnC family leucine-responsive transcriptional regulator